MWDATKLVIHKLSMICHYMFIKTDLGAHAHKQKNKFININGCQNITSPKNAQI